VVINPGVHSDFEVFGVPQNGPFSFVRAFVLSRKRVPGCLAQCHKPVR
jgi:hypothetical protein